ncbi:MAG TPA: hypothetical protein VFZ23_09715 [Pyrinomonadaceae bacterium]
MNDQEKDDRDHHGLADNVSGLGQKIIGKIETIGGVLTGDPITQAEGEYNVEIGDVREDLEEDLEESNRGDAETQSENE